MITSGVKAALAGEYPFDGKLYFFSGNQYWRYDLRKDYGEVDYPRELSEWKLPRAFESVVDASLPGENQYAGKAYLFRGPWFASYEWRNGRVSEAKPLYDWGSGRPFPFPSGIDAALAGAGQYKGKSYFFKRDKYVRYDWKDDKIDLFDQSIANWKLGAGFASDIDACVTVLEGTANPRHVAYFFKGAEYVKYDWAAERVLDGYPLPIAAGWPTGCAVWAAHSQSPSNVGPDPRLDRGANRFAAYPYGTIAGQAGWQATVRFRTVLDLADALEALVIPEWYGDDQAGKAYVPRGRITRLAICGHGMGGAIKINGEYRSSDPTARYTVASREDVTGMGVLQDPPLQNYFRRVARMLAPQAPVLFLGCQVGQTQTGSDFLVTLSELMPGHSVTGLTSIGWSGGAWSRRSDGYDEAGMKDTDWLSQDDRRRNPGGSWMDLTAWPWASETSPRAKTILNGKIIHKPERDKP